MSDLEGESGSENEYMSGVDDDDDLPKKEVVLPRVSGAVADEEIADDDDDDDNSLLNTDDDDDDDEDDDDENNELFKEFNPDAQPEPKKKTIGRRKPEIVNAEQPDSDGEQNDYNPEDDDDEDDDEDDDDLQAGEKYLQKFNNAIRRNVVVNHHPELAQHNYEEIDALTTIVRDKNGLIVDPLHRTLPFLTKYERARVLGERAKQINSGAAPFVKVEESVIDGYLIACKELEERKLPFIIKRPMTNGGCEYWKLKDLEMI